MQTRRQVNTDDVLCSEPARSRTLPGARGETGASEIERLKAIVADHGYELLI
jgi:hypothetical protein